MITQIENKQLRDTLNRILGDTTTARHPDPELHAIEAIIGVIETIDGPARFRVLSYVMERCGACDLESTFAPHVGL